MADTYTPAERLILHAAHRYNQEFNSKATQKARQIASARLDAFAEVAADCFKLCMAPPGFKMALWETLVVHPLPSLRTVSRERAVEQRAEWERTFLDEFCNHEFITGERVRA